MRIVNLILRTSVGVVDSWQEMVFEPDQATHRKLRRVRAAAGDFERNSTASGKMRRHAGNAHQHNH